MSSGHKRVIPLLAWLVSLKLFVKLCLLFVIVITDKTVSRTNSQTSRYKDTQSSDAPCVEN